MTTLQTDKTLPISYSWNDYASSGVFHFLGSSLAFDGVQCRIFYCRRRITALYIEKILQEWYNEMPYSAQEDSIEINNTN
jgi:hypothetical protein